jgi:hypothetical protein
MEPEYVNRLFIKVANPGDGIQLTKLAISDFLNARLATQGEKINKIINCNNNQRRIFIEKPIRGTNNGKRIKMFWVQIITKAATM